MLVCACCPALTETTDFEEAGEVVVHEQKKGTKGTLEQEEGAGGREKGRLNDEDRS